MLGSTNAAMFTADGEVVQAAEMLYKKPILVERGSFRPVTNVTLDMLNNAQAQFIQEPGVQGEELVVLMEMTLKNLAAAGEIDHRDFLDRVDIVGTLGKGVLILNYGAYFRLASYLFRYTKKNIGIVMGIPRRCAIFDENYYADLEGGILESFGRLFRNDLKLYVYPLRPSRDQPLVTAENLQVAPHLRDLYAYLLRNRSIESIRGYQEEYLPIFSRDVLAKLRAGQAGWEKMVPPPVAHMIKRRKLLGFRDTRTSGRQNSKRKVETSAAASWTRECCSEAGISKYMDVDLPRPIATYVAAENSGDAEALAQCFAEDAVVRDEGQTIEGLTAIKQWKAETRKKYQHTIEPLASVQKDDKTIVTNRLTGNFPGSPIELEFVFTLAGNKIASLEICS